MVVDVIVVMEVIIAVVLSLSSLFFVAVVAIASVLADAVIAVAMMTAVASSGSYLSFSSAAAMALADAEIPAANFKLVKLISGVACQRRFLLEIIF